ncbi:MAG: hypothetical protein WD274_03535 [Acidimicrobiia bacterium]
MLIGIGFLALITAAVAAHFVESDGEEGESELVAEMSRLHARLDTIEDLLSERAATPPDGSSTARGNLPGPTLNVQSVRLSEEKED